MKQDTRSLVKILLIVLIVMGCFSLLAGTQDPTQDPEYQNALSTARDLADRDLCQLSIRQYEKAIGLADSQALREEELQVYEKWYREDPDSEVLSSYTQALESASNAFAQNEDFAMKLADLYVQSERNQEAYRLLSRCVDLGMDSQRVTDKLQQVRYSYEVTFVYLTDYKPYSNGYYPARDLNGWNLMDSTGSGDGSLDYAEYVSQVGQDGLYIYCGEKNLILDTEGVINGHLSFVPEDARTFSEGYIAIKHSGRFDFYNTYGDKLFGSYLDAGDFQKGMAPVCGEDGKWYFIGTDGKALGQDTYEEIRLNHDGTWLTDGFCLLKKDGRYSLYQYEEGFTKVGDLSLEKVDVITSDGLIAFEKDGKWGFFNTLGQVVIEPSYEEARSFSNGLAAVKVNGKWGFISRENQLVIQASFLDADYFNDQGGCIVRKDETGLGMIVLKVHA